SSIAIDGSALARATIVFLSQAVTRMLPFTFEIDRWAVPRGEYVRSNREDELADTDRIARQRSVQITGRIKYFVVLRVLIIGLTERVAQNFSKPSSSRTFSL